MLLVITTNLATLRVRVSWRARLLAARPKSGDGGGSDGPGNGKREFPPLLSLSTVGAAAIGLATTAADDEDEQTDRLDGLSVGASAAAAAGARKAEQTKHVQIGVTTPGGATTTSNIPTIFYLILEPAGLDNIFKYNWNFGRVSSAGTARRGGFHLPATKIGPEGRHVKYIVVVARSTFVKRHQQTPWTWQRKTIGLHRQAVQI